MPLPNIEKIWSMIIHLIVAITTSLLRNSKDFFVDSKKLSFSVQLADVSARFSIIFMAKGSRTRALS